jgi:nucleoside phosphorylase
VESRDSSTRPSALMLGRLQFLEAERIAGLRPWEPYISRGDSLEGCERPSAVRDRIVAPDKSEVSHPVDATRREGVPKIIYGRIGSANTLLKNAVVRDLVRDAANVCAFEMEGSGIADSAWTFGQQYLLIRGICDYGDMSKVDEWQGYASVVAAAYARALIEAVAVEAL